MDNKCVWNKYNATQLKELESFTSDYINFISECKTERECVEKIVNDIEKEGYIDINNAIKAGKKLKAGDKVYSVKMNKSIIMMNVGSDKLEDGVNILGAHIDSPRLDVKANPLYEDSGIAYLDTHYYGGIKKYQWVTIPLAIHGVVAKKDGTTAIINLGEEDSDPVFFISDLLIHLSQEQLEKKAAKVIEGEALDIIIGNKPAAKDDKNTKAKTTKEDKEEKEAVKKSVLDILKKYYDIEEEDFLSAELEIVPAGKAREAGFDRSMVLGYGQDDRVCAFPSYKSMLKVKKVKRTAVCILTDKEEIGSVGATGMQSQLFENVMAELLNLCDDYSEIKLKRMLANSNMLSSDVSSAFDPSYASSFDKKNVAYLGKGMVLCKFTGSRGKSGSNDANAEYLGALRSIFAKDNVDFQLAELGKVDLGGGGTIAFMLAKYGMNVIDCGVAVLNMHAPYEATSKADIYETYRGYISFLKNI
ncbi:Aspartyl aminopeptidase [Lachnospiraceae bacterium G41]|nr:Aspartyl aminopeptidase [Lachnospiraceae bacterium G41]